MVNLTPLPKSVQNMIEAGPEGATHYVEDCGNFWEHLVKVVPAVDESPEEYYNTHYGDDKKTWHPVSMATIEGNGIMGAMKPIPEGVFDEQV